MDVDVSDFGAKGDGITDDTDAIQTAVNACSRGIIWFGPGTFLLSKAITCSTKLNFAFVGAGKGITVLKSIIVPNISSQGGAPTMLTISNCSNFSTEYITFDNNNILTTVRTTMLSASSCLNFSFLDCEFINAKYSALSIQSCARFWISRNYFFVNELRGSQQTNAIALFDNTSQTSNGWINDNEIVGAESGGRGVDIVWENNRITNFGYGSGIYSGHDGVGFGTHRWTLIGNTISGGQPAPDANGFYPKGIEVYAANSRIIGNNCRNNGSHGIMFGGSRSIVANNQCYDNGCAGQPNAAGVAASCVSNIAPNSFNPSGSIITGNTCPISQYQTHGFTKTGNDVSAITGLVFAGNDFAPA